MPSQSPHDTYTSPLASRNASPDMLRIWSPRHKFNTWRRIWLAVAEAQRACGLPITDEQIAELRAVVERGITDEELARAAELERDLRHDVMAHVHCLGEQCPKAKPIIHLGCTSQDVVCNADLLAVKDALGLTIAKMVRVVDAFGINALRYRHHPTLGFTHFQAAQPVTVGRRLASWASDSSILIERLASLESSLRPRGLRGATGTQAAFFALLPRQSYESSFQDEVREYIGSRGVLLAESSQVQYSSTAERALREVIQKGVIQEVEGQCGQIIVRALGWDRGYPSTTAATYASQLEYYRPLFSKRRWKEAVEKKNSEKLATLEKTFLAKIGFDRPSNFLSGQTYPRVIDTFVLADLASIASVLHKIATDIRLLSNRKELDEPFGKSQIGSSAMPYKRNPMKCERICGLARFVMNMVGNAYDTAATQWLERTLDDSSNRRLSLPESFLALDGCLDLMHEVASGLVVNEAMVRKNLMEELPFLATENILMEAVKAGGDRQDLHEAIRVHAQAAGHRVKQEGLDNDLLDRLKKDPAFQSKARGGQLERDLNWDNLMDPMQYVGRSVEQTERFVREVVEPLRERYKDELANLGPSDRGV